MTRKKDIAILLIGIALLAWPSISAAKTWSIDPVHSATVFSARHMMISNVHGTFENIAGTILYVPGDLKSVKVEVAIEAATINTRNPKRDNHLPPQPGFP